MAHDSRRSTRVAEAIREEVATFLSEDVKDPRVRGLVTVTGVDVSRDLRHARVYVSVMGSDEERAATYEGLDSVAAHLRSRIGRALRLRLAPEITFREDQSVAHAARIESLLAGLRTDGAAGDEGAVSEGAVSEGVGGEGAGGEGAGGEGAASGGAVDESAASEDASAEPGSRGREDESVG